MTPLRRRLFLIGLIGMLVLVATTFLASPAGAAETAANCPEPGSEFDEYRQRGWTWAYLASFGFGFLTSLTPCVYPMIPIVLGVFGARGEQVGRGKAMVLATLYVVGMGVTYSTLGIVFALVGGQFGSILANPWFVVPIVLLYAALAASMFGAFELNLPASWQAKLSNVGGAGYGGAFGMGLVGGFTAAPCTGPFLVGLLGFVARSGNVPVGGTLLFTYAIGMGVLFWVLAAFAVALPKSGRWMEWVKSIGGIGLVAAALYFMRPIVPALRDFGSPELWFLAVGIGITVLGIGLGAIHLSFHDSVGVKVRKAFAVLLAVAGVTVVIAWLLTPDRHLPWIQRDEDAAFAQARAQGKGVMIDFSADWCTPCAELELTFADPEVYRTLTEHFVPLKIDVSEGTEADDALQEKYGAESLPAVVFLDASGRELGRVSAYQEPGAFLGTVRPAVARLKGELDGTPCVAAR